MMTLTEELNEKIQQWLKWDRNNDTINEIKGLVEKSEWEILNKKLTNRLLFGTAGLRGPMQCGYNAMNDLVIIQTAQGLCNYILECFPNELDRSRGIILGYDGRYNSERFAKLTACIFINAGIPVYLYSEMVATPFVPFGIIEKKCLAGVMVTASHNPKQDNGYKVYWSNGAQIISPHDKNIQKFIVKNLCPLETSWNLNILKNTNLLHDPFNDMFKLYFEKLLKNIPKNLISINETSDLKFVYTAMHGVGYPFVEKSFEIAKLQSLIAVMEQRDPDPEFSTVTFPNPEEGKSSLKYSIDLAKKEGISIILANDPDADRLACAELNSSSKEYKVFSGNELGALLGWWSVQTYLMENPNGNLNDCYLLASTVSSKILKSMAKVDGFHFEETLTGFKWMGNRAIKLLQGKKEVLFAFEEAIGFMFTPTVLDKDGVSAACHLATMACYLKKNGNLTLQDKLNELYEKYGYHCTITKYLFCYEPETIKRIFNKIRNYNNVENKYPNSIGDYKISSIRDLTTGIDTSQPDGKALLPSSSSTQMITFNFVNGVVVTLRTSGTEPKIKYYAEMCAKPEERDWESLRITLTKLVDEIVEKLLEPKLNNLTPPPE